MIVEWNVAFTRKWLVGHVLAFGFDAAAGVWIVVDPCRHETEVQALRPAAFDRWIVQQAAEGEVWRIARQGRTPMLFPGLWCVGAVKRLVGLRSGALSPAGLKRDLLRAGARRVFSHEGQSSEGAEGRPGDRRGA